MFRTKLLGCLLLFMVILTQRGTGAEIRAPYQPPIYLYQSQTLISDEHANSGMVEGLMNYLTEPSLFGYCYGADIGLLLLTVGIIYVSYPNLFMKYGFVMGGGAFVWGAITILVLFPSQ